MDTISSLAPDAERWLKLLEPQSPLVRLLLGTKYIRIVGRRFIRQYTTVPFDGIKFKVRTNDASERYMVTEIFERKVYDRMFTVEPGDFVVDVGANMGAFSIRAAKFAGASGSVLAIEPESTNFALLTHNIRLNRLANIKTLKLALGDKEGMITLNVYRSRGSNSVIRRKGEILERTESVHLEKLDHTVAEWGARRVDVLKIDTEGVELSVLKGGLESLRRSRPKIVLETHPWGEPASEILSFLKELDYKVTYDKSKDGTGMVYGLP